MSVKNTKKEKVPEHTLNYADLELPYTWRQTLKDVEVLVKLPPNTKAKQLFIQIKPKSLKVAFKDSPEPLFEGEFYSMVRIEESTWVIEEGPTLVIQLEKIKQDVRWPHVLTHHPQIDVKKIEPSGHKLKDLDFDTRNMVEKMMHEQGAKGLFPPKNELESEDILKQFEEQNIGVDWNEE
jgi:hypothetical protein